MLPAAARLTRREDFTTAVRRGRRASRGTVVVHVAVVHVAVVDVARGSGPTRVGFVVSRAVGGSVVRHRVQRRLRHQMRERWDRLPVSSLVVVRALPPAATASSATLGRDLDAALTRVLSPGRRR